MTTTKPPSCGTPRTRRLEHSERTELPSARKQWVSWQTNFAMHCVRSEHNCLTSVSSPLALSAVLAMLFLAGDEKTRMEIAKVMKSPQGLAKEVMRCFQKVFAEFRNHSKIRFAADIFVSGCLEVPDEFIMLTAELFGSVVKDTTTIDSVLRNADVYSPQTRVALVASTVVTAPWIVDEAKESRYYPFMSSYATRNGCQPYIVLSGRFRCLKARVYEAWMLPLGSAEGSQAKLALIIIRPVCVGLLSDMIERIHGYSFRGLIKRIVKQQEQRSRVLIPKFHIPFKSKRDSPTDLLSKSPNPYQNCEFPGISAEHTKLDHFFYNAAVSFSRSGVGFFDDEDPSSAIVSSPSQRSEFNHPTGVSKLAPEVFSVRFDSPFVFAIVDCVTEAVLTIGSYSGPQGVPAEVLSRTYKKPRFCERRNANERKKCSVM